MGGDNRHPDYPASQSQLSHKRSYNVVQAKYLSSLCSEELMIPPPFKDALYRWEDLFFLDRNIGCTRDRGNATKAVPFIRVTSPILRVRLQILTKDSWNRGPVRDTRLLGRSYRPHARSSYVLQNRNSPRGKDGALPRRLVRGRSGFRALECWMGA